MNLRTEIKKRPTGVVPRRVRRFFGTFLFLTIISFGVFILSASCELAEESAQRPPSFHSTVNMVAVRVAVTDRMNRYVGDLQKENFKIFENKAEQTISNFSRDTSPLSMGIILDISGSMARNFNGAKSSVVRFLEQCTEQDEFFLVTFTDRPRLVQDFTNRPENIRNSAALLKAAGSTAFYDAVYFGLQKLREAHNEKKALIVITDGEDNSSRYSFSDLKDFAKESDALIYVIAQDPRKLPVIDYCHRIIKQLVDLTGGRAFFTDYLDGIENHFDLIQTELRKQYVLGYTPSNTVKDGKWRKIKLHLELPPGAQKLIVRAREGYFAPKS